jgi:hypothetical protein
MLNAAVIGTGLIATQKHLPAWRRMRQTARVAAVCDVDLARATDVARRFGVPNAYDDGIASSLLAVLSDRQLRERMVSRGYRRVKAFSWERTAQLTLDAYRAAAAPLGERRSETGGSAS